MWVLVRATDGLIVRVQPGPAPRGLGEAWPDFVWIEAADDWEVPVAPPPTLENPVPGCYLDLDALGNATSAKRLDAAKGFKPFANVANAEKLAKRTDEVAAHAAFMLARGIRRTLESEADQIRADAKALKSEYLRARAEEKARAKEVENAARVEELSLAVDVAQATLEAERVKPDKIVRVAAKAQKVRK